MANIEAEVLLSDEFVDFSKKIAVLHEQRKTVKQEIQDRLALMKALDEEAVGLQSIYSQWVDSRKAAKK